MSGPYSVGHSASPILKFVWFDHYVVFLCSLIDFECMPACILH